MHSTVVALHSLPQEHSTAHRGVVMRGELVPCVVLSVVFATDMTPRCELCMIKMPNLDGFSGKPPATKANQCNSACLQLVVRNKIVGAR